MTIKPHKNEWTRLRRKYWRAHENFARTDKRKRRQYWQHEVTRIARRLGSLARRYPALVPAADIIYAGKSGKYATHYARPL